ncbi:hypothetical protein BH18ACT11_BH18ACT11_12470 [soil metagenome]
MVCDPDNSRTREEEARRIKLERQRLERKAKKRREKASRVARAKQRMASREQREAEEKQRRLIESLLHRDAVADDINYMSGRELETFMAALFRQKGYEVEETHATGDQGVDLLLPDLDGKRIAIQLKPWTGPVGNAVVASTFAGMAYYQTQEGWIITTSSFTKSARELARRTIRQKRDCHAPRRSTCAR